MATATETDLARVAAVSDEIRQMGRQAHLMRLQATNAVVMTQSRGMRVPGFDAVATQMGQLSRELGSCIARLREVTARWLGAISARLGAEREVLMLADALRTAPARAIADVTEVLAHTREELDADLRSRRERRAFLLVLDDARDLAATGCVLARTAKLEATYGGELASALAETAGSFTSLVDAVDEAVRAIARRMTQEIIA
jgi:hypothetical protein